MELAASEARWLACLRSGWRLGARCAFCGRIARRLILGDYGGGEQLDEPCRQFEGPCGKAGFPGCEVLVLGLRLEGILERFCLCGDFWGRFREEQGERL